MTSKEELTALMANGDPETKISLLKKAVVNVTKQKQVLEQHNQQLQEQMTTIGYELSRLQEENQGLQRKLSAVTSELEAERKLKQGGGGNSKYGWKGFSSLVSGAEGEGSTGAKRGTAAGTVSLSLEDQEKIVMENEAIHRQLFELKSSSEDEIRQWRTRGEQLESEMSELKRTLTDLQENYDIARQKNEKLNAQRCKQDALIQFCKHFFLLSLDVQSQSMSESVSTRLTLIPSLAERGGSAPPHGVSKELVIGTASDVAFFIDTLMGSVAILIAALRDVVGSQMKHATVSDIRCYKDRLTTLLEVHNARKTSILIDAQLLERLINSQSGSKDAISQLLEVQQRLLTSFDQWLAIMSEHSLLLVDACSKIEDSAGHEEVRHNVQSTATSLMEALSAVRGAVEALVFICSDSEAILRKENCDSVEWLMALQRFWWEGCSALAPLRQSMNHVMVFLSHLVDSKSLSRGRTAVQYIIDIIETFMLQLQAEQLCGQEIIKSGKRKYVMSGQTSQKTYPLCNDKELIAALAVTDRAAVCYHTQMNFVMMELANKQSALDDAKKENIRLEYLNQQQCIESERVREALQAQISLLSEKLVEYTCPSQ
ncbi:hypothetical protein ERJ75_001615100 [Trypanosoma vivax]|uniref:Uncharacterized protein n=1 Tax=Trypanosoma vivax (strain Y486) TaxID=1055687 RepID=G0TTF9_TRYVY|nr:hypothetical protein TRVL_08117 [Trypanosoma vivax]KAH8605594.1 hypothetical protein ERJ75_001615100 [Trypanosoma vivax]CCC47240.1 conserved hypothetical protein [Trypanosoma vivax Y486]